MTVASGPHGRSTTGITLIELIVGILVSTIVLIGVGSILIGAWLTQSDVLSTSEATNRGQLVSSAVEKAMRNGLALRCLPGRHDTDGRDHIQRSAQVPGIPSH